MFHRKQNTLSRYFASEGTIAMEDILPQEAKIDKSANCLAGHGRAALKMNKCLRSTGGYGLDVVIYGQSGPEKSWTVPSLLTSLYITLSTSLALTLYSRSTGTTVSAGFPLKFSTFHSFQQR